MLRQYQLSRTLFHKNRWYFSTSGAESLEVLPDEEQWQKLFGAFKMRITDIKPETIQFYIPPSQKEGTDVRDFFLEQRRLYMKRQLLPHRQWALEKFGIPLEWPRRPRWREEGNLLSTEFGSIPPANKKMAHKNDHGLVPPIYNPFDHHSFPDNLMKQDREKFLEHPEDKEWFDMMPTVLKQLRVAARVKLNPGKFHDLEGLYNEDGTPAVEELSYEDYVQTPRDRNAWSTAMNRRKRAMILLKALQYEKIQPEHLMYTELDMVVYELLKLNKYDPDKPARVDRKTSPKNYMEKVAKPKRHYIRNERSKATRLRGYLEWYWKNSLEGRELMKKKRTKNGKKDNGQYEKNIKESINILDKELNQIRINLDTATVNIEQLDKVIEVTNAKDLPEKDLKTSMDNYNEQNPNWFDKRWKWLMYKEDLLKDFTRVKEIKEYFTFRSSDFEDPHDLPDSKWGTPHYPYSDLVYETGFPTGLEKESLQRHHEARQTWHDTNEMYEPHHKVWKETIIAQQSKNF